MRSSKTCETEICLALVILGLYKLGLNYNCGQSLSMTLGACITLNKDTLTGWSTEDPKNNLITWTTFKADVKKIELQFRNDENAQMADLKINYCKN